MCIRDRYRFAPEKPIWLMTYRIRMAVPTASATPVFSAKPVMGVTASPAQASTCLLYTSRCV